MGFVIINDEEYDALHGQPTTWWVVYIAIKRYIDWETRIAGVKRRFNEQYFRNVLEVEEGRGRHKKTQVSRQKIRSCIDGLVRIGLLEDRKNFIFFLLKANKGELSLNDQQPMSNQKSNRMSNQKKRAQTSMNIGFDKNEQPDEEPSTSAMSNPLPDLNIYNYKKHNYIYEPKKTLHELPDYFVVTDEHRKKAREKGWRSPDDLIDAFKEYHQGLGNKWKNWNLAFYSWMRKDLEWNKPNEKASRSFRSNGRGTASDITRNVIESCLEEYIRIDEGEKAEVD